MCQSLPGSPHQFLTECGPGKRRGGLAEGPGSDVSTVAPLGRKLQGFCERFQL